MSVYRSAATLGLAGGFVSILILRLLLGLGESVTFPGSQLLLARHTVEHERGRANGLIGAGQGIYAVTTALVGAASDRWIRAGGSTARVRKTFVLTSDHFGGHGGDWNDGVGPHHSTGRTDSMAG